MSEPTHAELYLELDELIVDRFNPRDDDSVNAFTVIDDVADFIESLPCDCPHDPAEDTCDRCRMLGRRRDEAISR